MTWFNPCNKHLRWMLLFASFYRCGHWDPGKLNQPARKELQWGLNPYEPDPKDPNCWCHLIVLPFCFSPTLLLLIPLLAYAQIPRTPCTNTHPLSKSVSSNVKSCPGICIRPDWIRAPVGWYTLEEGNSPVIQGESAAPAPSAVRLHFGPRAGPFHGTRAVPLAGNLLQVNRDTWIPGSTPQVMPAFQSQQS